MPHIKLKKLGPKLGKNGFAKNSSQAFRIEEQKLFGYGVYQALFQQVMLQWITLKIGFMELMEDGQVWLL